MPLSHTHFPDRLKQARSKKELSQGKLAAIAGLTQPQLSRLEAGKESTENGVTLAVFVRIVNALEIPAESLLK